MDALLTGFLGQCHAAVSGQGGLIGSLLVMGLLGGLTHCAGMCGPFVLSQVSARLAEVPVAQMREWHRLAGAAVVPYHLGRATTYGLLGSLLGGFAGEMADPGPFRIISALLLVLAALLLVGNALPSLHRFVPRTGNAWGARVARAVGPFLARPLGWRGYVLGLALGFIPCGLLYSALAAAAASGSAVAGGLGMLAFAAGTAPGLLVVGLLGQVAARRWREPFLKWAPALLLLNAGVLTFFAWRLVA